MSDYLPFLIFGITTGSIYGLSAMGLVLTYKTSGVFNIAHGAVGAAGAYTFYGLREQAGMSWPLAAVLVVLIYGLVGGLVLERLAVVLAPVSTAYKIVGTVGLLVAIRAVIVLRFSEVGLSFQTFLPQETAFSIADVSVTVEQLTTFLLAVLSAIGLSLFFRWSRLGVAMRGVVDDPQLIDMAGTSPTRVRRSAWVIGTVFAAVSGVLFASNQAQIDVNVLTLLVVQAFGAATLAQFKSISGAFVGGLVVGIAQKLVSKAIVPYPDLQGLDLIVPFLILLLGLLLIPRRRLVEAGRTSRVQDFRPRDLSPAWSRSGLVLLAIVALLLPMLVGSRLTAYNIALSQVALFASLHLLVRTSGQISLCHVGFAAVGAAGFGHALGAGMPFVLAVLAGGVVTLVPALFVSVPAIRLSGLFLALATLGFGIVLAQFLYGKPFMFGSGQLATRRPAGFEDDESYYYVLLAVAVVALVLVTAVERARMGRLLRAMSDSSVALSTLGTSVNVTRVLVFCLSGFLAGISGAMYASLFGSVTLDTFNYFQSIVGLAVLTICGRRLVIAAVGAPILLYVVPNYISGVTFNQYLQLGFGLGAILAAGLSRFGGRLPGLHTEKGDRSLSPAAVRVHEQRQRVPAGAGVS